MKNQNIKIRFVQGYGGVPKAEVTIDGEMCVLDLDYLKKKLENDMHEKGYKISQTKKQKYPRVIIND